ncbi:hypothetical protein ACHWQZ_G001568 [Mnemiopsis leidyi]
MSCIEHIAELRQQQERTLELYKELYDSFVAPKATDSFINFDISAVEKNDGSDVSKYRASLYQDVSNMVEETQQSLDSTCDIPRMTSQNTTISEMWNNFSIEKYAPREKKLPVKTMSAPPIKKSKPRTPRVTIPDPFYMTLREELKKPSKTKAQEEAELKRLQKELEEEAECRKQFKASPIPSSTFQSRLRLIEEKQENRRRKVKEQSKALTKALQKPFSFDQRTNLRRSRSLSALDTEAKKRKGGSVKFQARPMPHHIFDPVVDEKAKEEEAYRQIKIKMRAEQLLAESDLPASMKRHAIHYTDGKIRRQIREENETRAHLTEEHTFTPAIKDYVPDYSFLHKQQEAAILERQSARPTTVVEPFNLRTEQLAQLRQRAPKSSPEPGEAPPPPRHSVRSPCLYTGVYEDVAPARPTVSSSLRDSATRQKLLQEKKKAQLEYEQDLSNKIRQLEIRRSITEKSKALDPSLSVKAVTQQKLKEKIAEQRQKELEYREKLEGMKDKLKDRPFLFERISMETARLSADKAFRKALQNAGLDSSLIEDISHYEEDSLMQ